MSEELAEKVKAKAHELGFDLVGITGAEPSSFAPQYRAWLDRGYAGEMEYLSRNLDRRLDPRTLLSDARSIIVVGMNYYTDSSEPSHLTPQPLNPKPYTQHRRFRPIRPRRRLP